MPLLESIKALGDNQIFAGGLGVMILTGLGKAGLPASRVINAELRRKFTVTREVTTKDSEIFEIIASYINKNMPGMKNHSTMSFLKKGSTRSLDSKPTPGIYYSKFDNAWMQIERNRTNNMSQIPFESIKITTRAYPIFGLSKNSLHGNQILDNIFEKARNDYDQAINDSIVIYEPETSTWRTFGNPIKKRSLNSVILDKNISNEISQDMIRFLRSEDWYNTHGINHQRGYLFYGPPGTGKTSYIKALAGALNYNLAIFNVGSWHMDDHRLFTLMNNVPPGTIILFEDIDCCMPKTSRTGPANQNPETDQYNKFAGMQGSISMSGLLNALDGIIGGQGRIICMTTNYIDRLDPALLRPGRCDMKQYFGHASDSQISQMYQSFFPDIENVEKLSKEFTKTLKQQIDLAKGPGSSNLISPAEVQNILMFQRENPHFFREQASEKDVRYSKKVEDLTDEEVREYQRKRMEAIKS